MCFTVFKIKQLLYYSLKTLANILKNIINWIIYYYII